MKPSPLRSQHLPASTVVFLILTALSLYAKPPQSALASQIERRIRDSGADVAVAFRTIDGKQELLVAPDRVFHAASTMKIPVMIELFAQAKAGKIGLDDNLVVTNRFRSIVDGTVYKLDPADDSDPEVYRQAGKPMTLRRLCEHMITGSSNLATNLLIERLGVSNIQATARRLDAGGMTVLRGVEDSKAFQKDLNNTTSARALLQLLWSIAKLKAVDSKSSREMIEILSRQKFNDAIPAGLPPGIRVAHKTGDITRVLHDAAIVYAEHPFILVVLVHGPESMEQRRKLISDIAGAVYRSSQR